jgi:hypothetical protein
MTSLEGICAPTRADSDTPAGLTSLHRETPSSTLAEGPQRARGTAPVRFAVFLLRSPEARRSHDAGRRYRPDVDVQRASVLYARVGPWAADAARLPDRLANSLAGRAGKQFGSNHVALSDECSPKPVRRSAGCTVPVTWRLTHSKVNRSPIHRRRAHRRSKPPQTANGPGPSGTVEFDLAQPWCCRLSSGRIGG